MDTKGTFAENVLLLDTAFVNEVVRNLKITLEARLKRALSDIDLPVWITCLALDAGLRGEGNELQVLLLHDDATSGVKGCRPSRWEELDGQACRTAVGELAFSCVTPSTIASREALFLDLMTLALDATDVKRLLLLPSHFEYGDKMEETLYKLQREEAGVALNKVVYFALKNGVKPEPFHREAVHYSLLHVWGIRPEEL